MRGLLVAVEGIDGAGKTGLIHGLVARLAAEGRAARRVRRYMVGEISDLWWRLVRADEIDQHGTAVLAAADHAVGLERIVRPALAEGEVVLLDKYLWSHLVYFMLRGLERERLEAMFGESLMPDVVLHLEVPVEVTLARLAATDGKPDLLECGLDHRLGVSIGAAFAEHGLGGAPAELRHRHFRAHQEAAAALFPDVLPPDRTVRIDADVTRDEVLEQALAVLPERVR